jgi:ankyrin repeat protein
MKATNFLYLSLLLFGATALGMNGLLIKAAQSGDLRMIEKLIAQGAEIETKDFYNRTPLIIAASYGREDVCKFLISNKALIEAKDDVKRSPLHCAARYGHAAVCKLLITNKASLLAINDQGLTPLANAAAMSNEALSIWRMKSHEYVCKMLIDAQLEPIIKDKAAIVAFLGIVKNRSRNLPCHMHYDVAKIIARQACETVRRNKPPIIEHINEQIKGIGDAASRAKWIAYLIDQCI